MVRRAWVWLSMGRDVRGGRAPMLLDEVPERGLQLGMSREAVRADEMGEDLDAVEAALLGPQRVVVERRGRPVAPSSGSGAVDVEEPKPIPEGGGPVRVRIRYARIYI